MAVTATSQTTQADTAAALNGAAAAKAKTAVQETSDRFLKLLVTQLKNQDPMNPMDNAQLTTQLAQMSTVEGVNKLNDGLDKLTAQYQATQMLQGAGLVGHQVLAEGTTLQLGSGGAAGGFDLKTSADQVSVQLTDANGAVVRSLALGKQDAGFTRFTWDGKDTAGNALASGEYSFKVSATAAGKAVEVTSYTLGSVLSVAMNNGAVSAEVSGLGERSLAQIKQIF